MAVKYRPEHRGRIANFLWPITSFVMGNLSVPVSWFLFFVLNRTRVIGRSNVPHERNTLLLSNHQSMIDSFLIGATAFYPYSWIKPFLVPWNPAAEENFFKNRLFAWVFDQFRAIPVARGRRDLKAIYRMMRALESGTMIVFPEGTRSRDGRVGKGRAGAGMVILGTHPKVVPIAIDGTGEVLPIGRRFPRFGRRVYVYFGAPIDYSDLVDRPRSKETAQAVVDRVLAAIRRQHEALRRLRSRRERRRVGAGQNLPSGPSL